MSLNLRWGQEADRDRVGEIRGLCYGDSPTDVARLREHIKVDRRCGPGNWLIAERNGEGVGTASIYPQTMWVRGGAVPCQGVAYVGTVKTQRRRRAGDDAGVGTALMNETLRTARERGFVVSALMPFRGSYYEHFGYGIVERRAQWTVPLAIMPDGKFETVRFYDASKDREALVQCRQRLAQRGQADIERNDAAWEHYLDRNIAKDAFLVVDRTGDGPVRGWMAFTRVHNADASDTVKAEFDTGYEDLATLQRFLHLLASLRDQYTYASIELPRDLPLNLLLREMQITHRDKRNHPTADLRLFTRMQVRVIDHVKLLSAMRLPQEAKAGKVVVAIRESEGGVSKIAIEVAGGKLAAAPTDASADVEMTDRIWAMIALGDIAATRAAELALISVTNRAPLGVLDGLALGPAPYCREYF